MIKKREIDIFGVLLGIVIGCIIGFFLSTRINLNHPPEETDDTGAVYGNVFLLQIDKLDNADDARTLIAAIKDRNLHSVYVKSGDFYYVLGAIGNTEADLNNIKNSFEYKGFTSIVKKEYILDKVNAVLGDQVEYDFYKECIAHLLSSLGGKTFVISDALHNNRVNLEAYTLLLALQSLHDKPLGNEIRLNLYQEIINNLN